jgi:hypothetical protein
MVATSGDLDYLRTGVRDAHSDVVPPDRRYE